MNKQNKPELGNRRIAWLGLAGLLVVMLGLGGLWLTHSATAAERAGSQPTLSPDLAQPGKTIKLVRTERGAQAVKSGAQPAQAGSGQELLTVTLDFPRDPVAHQLSSQRGEVYLTDHSGRQIYRTVATALPAGAAPGQPPVRTVSFTFAVPQGATGLIFHYGPDYSQPVN